MIFQKSKLKIIKDFLYCIFAVIIMNLVLQIIIYPIINAKLGINKFGDFLFILGIINVIGPSLGLALNNTRLILESKNYSNRSYLNILNIFCLVSSIFILGVGIYKSYTFYKIFLIILVTILSIYRNYLCVEYRISLNYKKQCIFYLIISAGYLLGIVIFLFTFEWAYIMILGDLLGFIYIKYTGNILKTKKECTIITKKIFKTSTVLSGSYFLTNSMLNLDRFILSAFLNEVAVSNYYVLSLFGKTIALISGPLQSVIMGYFSKLKESITKKFYFKIVFFIVLIMISFSIICSVLTPIYIKIFYSSMPKFESYLYIIISCSQILYFATNLLLTIILNFTKVKWQLYIQLLYSLLYISMAIWFTCLWEFDGYSFANFICNIIYFLITVLIGYKSLVNKDIKY
ncbi:lipopolysaccharide biosynthesis protein [Clostridium sp. AUH-JLR23]|uniref:lipopolysaccharide biosynthesis protein n=1 Tax=Clostridium sp. AUH-JLR23 TaxID=1505062 RepID=UPI00356A345C